MINRLSGIWLIMLCMAPLTYADDQPVWTFNSGDRHVALIELFSSQGCSSCPRAERWMSSLMDDSRLWAEIVPVVFHVDYWDYLGWKDPYASIHNSQRQRRYKLHGHSQSVYTPGFMVAGREWSQWFNNPVLGPMVAKAAGQLKVEVRARQVYARFIRGDDNRGLILNVAVLGFDINTAVAGGENRGKRLAQDFVVLDHQTYSSDSGMWRAALGAPKYTGKRALAFWVSHASDPSPLQATGGWFPQAP